ncbi:GNAT family N-acetyltransferase [soil metagenome]
MPLSLRPMTASDLAHIDRLQHDAYRSEFREDLAVYGDKLAFFPRGCWIGCRGDVEVGYLFSHPFDAQHPPALNEVLSIDLARCDAYFVHDVVVHSSCRGVGLASLFVEQALQIARERSYPLIGLVAVQGARDYWARHGFRAVEDQPAISQSLQQSYGPDARYMARNTDL